MSTLSISEPELRPTLDPPAGAENSSACSGPRALVGRQPILDRALNVVGYELLFRPSAEEAAAPFDGNRATARVIINTVTEIGLNSIVGKHRAFINFTDEHLISGTAQLLPQKHVVIEVLEDVAVNDELLDALTGLVNAGYTLALDDFVYDPKWDCLLKIASIVKIDILASSSEEIRSMVERRKSLNVKLLAEKVETQEQFDEMFELGFDLFQGYFFTKPKVISHASVPENHISLLQLLATLQNKDANAGEIEGLVSQDVSLSYKLLRYLNSAHFALPQKIDSIHRAVVYFGLDLLRRWACLLAMANVDGKSAELLQTALVRARMCELIAERNAEIDADSFFIVGLFSTLDALLDMPIQDVLAELPLTAEIKDALTNFKGIRGEALRCVEACEKCEWSQMTVSDIEVNEIDNLYLKSINWTSEVRGGLS